VPLSTITWSTILNLKTSISWQFFFWKIKVNSTINYNNVLYSKEGNYIKNKKYQIDFWSWWIIPLPLIFVLYSMYSICMYVDKITYWRVMKQRKIYKNECFEPQYEIGLFIHYHCVFNVPVTVLFFLTNKHCSLLLEMLSLKKKYSRNLEYALGFEPILCWYHIIKSRFRKNFYWSCFIPKSLKNMGIVVRKILFKKKFVINANLTHYYEVLCSTDWWEGLAYLKSNKIYYFYGECISVSSTDGGVWKKRS
jgi:hypothetical protein